MQHLDDIFLAKSGFGGTEYLLSALLTGAKKRGLPLHRVAELLCFNPARRFGLSSKGDLAPGLDADIVLVDPDRGYTIHAAESESTQGYTPFEGIEVSATVMSTYLRGQLIYHDGKVIGEPCGRYLKRPC